TSSGALFSVTSSAGSGTLVNVPTQITPAAWSNTGSWTGTNASVTWANDIQGWNSTTSAGFTNGNIVIRNNTSAAQDFAVTIAMLGTATGPLVAAGSVGGQYVNGSASLGSLTSTGALWSAGIDGATVNTQLNNALFFAQPFQVISLGSFNFSNLAINSITDRASIRFSLRLSAGGEASFTSAFSFQAIPGPASLALIGFLPIMRSRRRR
ncbi:MAG: hypothetical protein RL692_893, partial [Planctomycetota bacterium]